MPHYNPNAWCKEVAGAGGGYSEMLFAGCMTQEQSAYDALKSQWDGLPQTMRSWCDEVASSGGVGSFMLLQGCVKQEAASASQNQTARFHR